MPDYSLVPVDHQPDFYDASLVPVDHDPFSDEGVVQQAQAQQGQLQPTRPEPANPTQPPTGGYETGGAPSTNLVQDGAEPLPFSGFANPTPAESLVNQQKMTDHRKVADADRTGKSGAITDGGDPYELVTTEQRNNATAFDHGSKRNDVYGDQSILCEARLALRHH